MDKNTRSALSESEIHFLILSFVFKIATGF